MKENTMENIQDKIELDLQVERTVVNDTVKITAFVDAIITEENDDALYARIRTMMNSFIPDAKWQFANMRRQNDSAGFERITLQAYARVPETENRNLHHRARAVSSKGLNISDYQVDDRIPQKMIDEAMRDMRVSILKLANEELARIKETMSGGWRVHHVDFRSGGASANQKGGVARSLTASASYGAGFSEDSGLGNAQKFTLAAAVVFARAVY